MTATSTTTASMKEATVKEEVQAAARGFGRRHLQLWLLSLGLGLAYSCRVNLSVCIVAMTKKDDNHPDQPEDFEWTEQQRGVVLSSFFWGYVLMQVPGATLSNRYGPVRFVLLGVAGSGVLSILSPLAASLGGWKLLCALRVLEGLCQGVIFPSVHFMLGRWAPPVERGRASAVVFGGPAAGTLCAMGGVGLLCASPLGWRSGFYVPGGLAALWGVVWWWQAANSPDSCSRISAVERDYIKDSLGSSSSGEKRLSVPWVAMLSTPCVWAVVAVHVCSNFGHWLMITQMPNYMNEMLHFDIKNNGLMSSLPYATLVLVSALVGWAAQLVNEADCVSIATSRKIFNSISHYGMGLSLLALAILTPIGMPTGLAVALLTMAIALEGGLVAGFLVNHVDLSPNFGGAMLGVSNGLGNVMGIVAPILASFVIGDAKLLSEEALATGWSRVFLIAACVYFTGNTIFVFFGRADVQPWNSPKDSDNDSKGTIITHL